MQKHERKALEAIKKVLVPLGWEVRVETGNRTHLVVWADKPGRRERHELSSSPRSRDHEITYARQWARRVARTK